MASVVLDFVKPNVPNYVKLRIYEAPASTGPFSQIEQVTVAYPNYPTRYTTNLAASVDDWFQIEWEDDKGAKSPRSNPVKGGTETVVGKITSRVMLRDPALNEEIVSQAAEWVVSVVMGTSDPYNTTLSPTYSQLEGMTLLALAHSAMATITSSSTGESYSAGLVSQKSTSGTVTSEKLIDYLLKQANSLLGLNITLVMLLEDIDPTGIGVVSGLDQDATRGIMTEYFG